MSKICEDIKLCAGQILFAFPISHLELHFRAATTEPTREKNVLRIKESLWPAFLARFFVTRRNVKWRSRNERAHSFDQTMKRVERSQKASATSKSKLNFKSKFFATKASEAISEAFSVSSNYFKYVLLFISFDARSTELNLHVILVDVYTCVNISTTHSRILRVHNFRRCCN